MHAMRILAALMAIGIPGAMADEVSTSTGVYTEEQAERGRLAYEVHCAQCHGMNLIATDDEAIDLVGLPFELSWGGKTLAEKLSVMGTMPPNDPGSLDFQTYLDIMAYILAFNDIPAGDSELTLEREDFDRIVVEPVED